MATTHAPPALLLGLLASVLGCADEPAPQWEGEHVIFFAEQPERVCAGTRGYLDARTGEMLERLGSEALKVEYHLVGDLSEHCTLGETVSGCGETGIVFSQSVPHLHEIVHARSGDGLPRVLEEGLATHLGDPYPIEPMAPRERLVELLTTDLDGVSSVPEYARAAHFIAFFVETFGWQSLLELDAALGMASSPAQLSAALESITGFDIDATLDAYAGYPDCDGFVDTSLACAEAAIPPGFPTTTHERVLDCTSTDGVGPHQGMVFVEDVIELGPAIDGTRTVSATGDGAAKGGFAVLRRCGPCSERGVGIAEAGLAFVPESELPAGRYLVRFYLPVDAGPATVGVRIDG